MQEPRLLWTEAEDVVLENLVQKATETQPYRWRRELSWLLSDPKERVDLDPSWSFAKSIQRLDQIQSQHSVSKKAMDPGRAWAVNDGSLFPDWKDFRRKVPPVCIPTMTRAIARLRQIMDTRRNHLESLKEVNWGRVTPEVGTKDHDQCRRLFALFNGNHAKAGGPQRGRSCSSKSGSIWTGLEKNR